MGLIPGSRRYHGGDDGNLFQYSCLGNSMDRGTWRAIVYGVAQSQTWLSTQNFLLPLTVKSLYFVQLLGIPFYLLDWMLPDSNRLLIQVSVYLLTENWVKIMYEHHTIFATSLENLNLTYAYLVYFSYWNCYLWEFNKQQRFTD